MTAAPRWRPTATIETLHRRADLLAEARRFMAERGVVEVDTPVLANTAVTDPDIEAVTARNGSQVLWLQTSPEFAMKRLLAAGAGPIYQLGKVFRAGESGRWHNVEFTMLEWYRPGFSLETLIDEVLALVRALTGRGDATVEDYGDVFERGVGLCPHRADDAALRERLLERVNLDEAVARSLERRGLLDLLFSECVQRDLSGVRVVRDYPATHAALARLSAGEPRVARRFELFIDGVELGNGYHELDDAAEQADRMSADAAERQRRGLMPVPADGRLLAALDAGMGDVCGVAVGFDRLVAVALDAERIGDVMPFTTETA